MKHTPVSNKPRFCYHNDPECRLGLDGGRFTRVQSFIWLIAATILTVATYGAMYAAMAFFPKSLDAIKARYVVIVFTERGFTQHVVVLFSYWSLCMLLIKLGKTKLQRQPLEFTDLVPIEADYVLSPATVNQVLTRLRHECDDPSRFILFNRIDLALSNLKNMGRIGDVDNVLTSQADNDEDIMESSYSIIRGLVWAIPVLGFIGTVQGLSVAIGGFSDAMGKSSSFDAIQSKLQPVTDGLSTAFETTFVALVAALCIQLFLTLVRKSEEEMLDECREYCQRHVISRLRLTFEFGG